MPFQKGKIGNPAGRPPAQKCLTYWVRRATELEIDDLRKKNEDIVKNPKCKIKTIEALGIRFVMECLGGNAKMFTELYNRLEGKIPQPVQVDPLGSDATNVLDKILTYDKYRQYIATEEQKKQPVNIDFVLDRRKQIN